MNVGMLKEMLEGHDDEQEVMIAYQPSWPLAAHVQSVTSLRDCVAEDDLEEAHQGDKPDAVWIVAGSAPYEDPYAPSAVFESW
jgi:hypothetical protein